MLHQANLDLITKFAGHIQSHDVLRAFELLVGVGASSSWYNCVAQEKGVIKDFRFYSPNEQQPFAFIVNKHSLLFYFRKPCIRSGAFKLEKLQHTFPSISINNAGEWTLAIQDLAIAAKLADTVLNEEILGDA